MTKPSKRKTSTSSRKPAPAAPKAAAPEQTVEELKQEIAKFDHDGDGHPGGSLPRHAEEQQPETVDEQPNVEEPKPEQDTAPTEEPKPAALPDTDARSQTVSLGPVECLMRRVPVEAVLGILSPEGLRRIEAHEGSASFESTRQRLLASDGRATPVVFEAATLAGEQPTILHGYEELAAARVSGVPDIPVILVPAGGASEAQSHIVEMVRQQRMKEQPSDDDELFYRIHAEG